jgi:3-hydroxyisobutyrate dehydrogenase
VPPTAIRRVGVVGLGRMGLPMARHLVRAGFAVRGFDVAPERRDALVAAGGSGAATVADLARDSDAVLVMVTDDAQVRAVALGGGGMDGVLGAVPQGGALIISSTVKPSTCVAVAQAAAGWGVGVLDAPVARGQRNAERGTLAVFVGGPSDLFERCRPVFEAFGEEIVHVGERVGMGQVAKLTNNLLLWAGVVAAHEALTLGERLGVAPARLREALLRGSGDSWVLRELHLINLTWPDKDLAQMIEAADEAGHALPLSRRVRELIGSLTREELRRLCG